MGGFNRSNLVIQHDMYLNSFFALESAIRVGSYPSSSQAVSLGGIRFQCLQFLHFYEADR